MWSEGIGAAVEVLLSAQGGKVTPQHQEIGAISALPLGDEIRHRKVLLELCFLHRRKIAPPALSLDRTGALPGFGKRLWLILLQVSQELRQYLVTARTQNPQRIEIGRVKAVGLGLVGEVVEGVVELGKQLVESTGHCAPDFLAARSHEPVRIVLRPGITGHESLTVLLSVHRLSSPTTLRLSRQLYPYFSQI